MTTAMVGPTILNLNQFPQYVTKAEALIEEITLICKDIPEIEVSATTTTPRAVGRRTPRKERLYTPPVT